jgi:CheY-like chemotaxis protein
LLPACLAQLPGPHKEEEGEFQGDADDLAAIALIRQSLPDIAVLDCEMPQLGGLGVVPVSWRSDRAAWMTLSSSAICLEHFVSLRV